MNTSTKPDSRSTLTRKQAASTKANWIKLSVDVHATTYVVVRQLDGGSLQPPQRMSPQQFVSFALKQKRIASRGVKVCYEAGPTGFDLARKLIDQDIQCIVVRPGRLDEYGRKVNNDRTDALALADRFDRHLQGNQRSLVEVRLPSQKEELRRAEGRQRQQFLRLRGSLAAMGRSLCLLHGVRVLGQWWQPHRWEQLQSELSEALSQMLQRSRQTILHLDEQISQLDKQLKQRGASQSRPRGLGALTLELIQSEVCCWDRFNNRKQPGSYAGLTGGVSATGNQHADLPITKAGNRRLRTYLVEASWRLVIHQPNCRLVERFKHVLGDPKAHRSKRKKAIVAMARVLITDLWRWQTDRKTLKEMGYGTID